MSSISGKSAIVTGASSGIGTATAKALANEGVNVVLAARREDRLQDLKAEIEREGGKAVVCVTDVTKVEDTKKLAEVAKSEFGSIDMLINNAGVMPLSFMDKLKVDEWRQMVDVNIHGVLNCIAHVLPVMLEQNSGHIFNISSVAGRRIFPGGAVYCLTKYGVRALSEGMRQELTPKKNIRITCIEPGAVKTELPETITDDDIMENFKEMMEMEMLQPEDIAEGILYAARQPGHVDVAEVMIIPRDQS
ncbi:SDR family oxidoreductase [Roseivirga sp. BDSF3-8]|uniref:SDR family oxidoreductase n=1 Tax=Roseivirga sp. BDSF3-8 TaxID=3241598 RepID=UPI003531B701